MANLLFQPRFNGFHGAFQKHELLVLQDLIHTELIRGGQGDAGQVPGRKHKIARFFGSDDESLGKAQIACDLGEHLGLRFGQVKALDHEQVVTGEARRERHAQGQLADLLVHLKIVFAGLGSEKDRAATPHGGTVGTGASAAGALLAPRLLAAATNLADAANDTYLKVSGDESGVASYGEVCDLLVNWHIQTVVLPSITVEESPFDPYDETQVDLSGIVNAR